MIMFDGNYLSLLGGWVERDTVKEYNTQTQLRLGPTPLDRSFSELILGPPRPDSEKALGRVKPDYECIQTQQAFFPLTEKKSGDEVISISFCLASLSACLDFIKSSLSIKASLALRESKTTIRLARKQYHDF